MRPNDNQLKALDKAGGMYNITFKWVDKLGRGKSESVILSECIYWTLGPVQSLYEVLRLSVPLHPVEAGFTEYFTSTGNKDGKFKLKSAHRLKVPTANARIEKNGETLDEETWVSRLPFSTMLQAPEYLKKVIEKKLLDNEDVLSHILLNKGWQLANIEPTPPNSNTNGGEYTRILVNTGFLTLKQVHDVLVAKKKDKALEGEFIFCEAAH
ncbi:hypothetical protein B0T26DRAFT_672802 [Lasiosphaeria miniovina]|uniref:Uncharacterized protein n=1 Tax=Lasiosphaeria miniovina TaxID=1954250 RepID=A0AA40EAE5_9PEZI|nr:uncharacterized protein B0T26DRAFT_672802 [Lasiosphaeria miniovina]KAK0728238.1 hypothetical protein B0T26DRAFT_672802 [Lasiosphaeria miniovina]